MSLFDELNSLADLQQLVDSGERESETLEYKAGSVPLQQSDRTEAAKDISAFANSMGGLVIYGIATDPVDKTKPLSLEAVDPSNVNYIQHAVMSAIRHPIPGIRTKSLPLGGVAEAFLIDVPQSPLAPHQVVPRSIYYRRQGVESVPMAHDLVELYFGRRMSARLEPSVTSFQLLRQDLNSGIRTMYVHLGLSNTGGQIGRDVLTRIHLAAGTDAQVQGVLGNVIPGPRPASENSRMFSHMHKDIYWPGVPIPFVQVSFDAEQSQLGNERPVFFLDVFAADSRPVRFMLFLSVVTTGALSLEWDIAGTPPVLV